VGDLDETMAPSFFSLVLNFAQMPKIKVFWLHIPFLMGDSFLYKKILKIFQHISIQILIR
jgi:hypothetical protein